MHDERPPVGEQACYDLGYENPAKHHRHFRWHHVVELNAYHCGQMDRQNQQPRNHSYARADYDPITGERK